MFSVAIFRFGGQESAPKCATFLSCKTLIKIMNSYTDHLLEITKCQNFINCAGTHCEQIVSVQKTSPKQVPEPWSGDLLNSKIVFVSSNPSISEREYYPTEDWNDEQLIDFFHNRFDQDGRYVKSYLYPIIKKGSELQYSRSWVRYWASIKSTASSLLESKAEPGKDYSLTEIVRCKSRNEIGVKNALETCSRKFFSKTLNLSNANTFVIVGSKAKMAFETVTQMKFLENKILACTLNGRERLFINLPHPNSRGLKKLNYIFNASDLKRIIQHSKK